MVTISELQTSFQSALKSGEKVRFRYFNVSGADTGYDDEIVLSQSGTDTWVSGVIQPVRSRFGSTDAQLLQQGRILMSDTKLYVDGSVNTSGIFRIGIGSANPPAREFAVIDGGVTEWLYQGTPIYKLLYIRYLTTGSLEGE